MKTSFALVLLALLFVISTATIITELLDKAQVKQRVEGWGPGFVDKADKPVIEAENRNRLPVANSPNQ